jgi:hypothetical protein
MTGGAVPVQAVLVSGSAEGTTMLVCDEVELTEPPAFVAVTTTLNVESTSAAVGT